MAVLVQVAVAPATHEKFIELDTRVGQLLMQSGGPPPGLMTNLVYPEADGFVIASVWRTHAEAEPYLNDVLSPLLAQLGLTVTQNTEYPVWSFARP